MWKLKICVIKISMKLRVCVCVTILPARWQMVTLPCPACSEGHQLKAACYTKACGNERGNSTWVENDADLMLDKIIFQKFSNMIELIAIKL